MLSPVGLRKYSGWGDVYETSSMTLSSKVVLDNEDVSSYPGF